MAARSLEFERGEEALGGSVDAPILSSGRRSTCGRACGAAAAKRLEDFSDDVALEATQYLGLSETLLGASCDVGSCPWVAAHSHERDHPEGPVRIAVTTSV